jgi:hypothetical protein
MTRGVGGLKKVANLTKWARVTPPGGFDLRWLVLAKALPAARVTGASLIPDQ